MNDETASLGFTKDFELLLSFMRSGVDDRTVAIVFTAYVDMYLGELIRLRMPGLDKSLTDKLFEPTGLLGPLMAKIDVAKSLACIDADFHHDMKVITRIRNRFAHRLAINTFNHPEIEGYMSKLRYKPHIVGYPERDAEQAAKFSALPGRSKFEVVATGFCISIHNTLMAYARQRNGTA